MGRTVETLCNACKPVRGGTWSRSGSIVFPSQDGGLLSIPDGGGEPQPVTSLDRAQDEIAHIAPQFLPDGRRFLYVIRSTQANRTGLYVGQVGRNEPRLLLRGEHPAIYAAPGYLLFTRAGNIVAQPFDLRRLELSGEPTSLVGRSEYSPTPLQGGDITSLISSGVWPSFSVSETGILTYAIAEHPDSQFQWRERAGEQPLQLLYQPGPYMTFDLSPDGTRLVFARRGEHSRLWVIDDLASGLATPLTFGASSYSSPRWASDAQGVVAHRTQPPPLAVVRIQPDGGESVVSGAENCMMDDVSKDGRFVLCRPPVERVLMAIPLSDGQKPITVRKAPGSMDQARFSPDGRWIAYNADDSGRHEVYVTAFPPTGAAPRPVSPGGGVQPVWRQDGRELYYLGLDGVLKAVVVSPGERPQFSSPTRLLDTGLAAPSPWVEQYAVSGDGQRFLILKPVEDRVRNSMGVILNWPALLQSGRSH